MFIKPLHPNFTMPSKGSAEAAAFDIHMPEAGMIHYGEVVRVPLGFASSIPKGHVALLLPRSGMGFKHGLEVNNTCGVIDSDYRGEWVAALKLKSPHESLSWEAGDRLLQFLVMPVPTIHLIEADELSTTDRADGGFGSTGK